MSNRFWSHVGLVVLSCGFAVSSLAFGKASLCKKEITFGWEVYAPFQTKDDKTGKQAGIDYDLISEITKRMGCTFKVVDSPWARTLADLEAGHLDMAGTASKTPEREKFAWYSDTYVVSRNVMFVRKGETSKYSFKTLADILKAPASFRLGVSRSYEYGDAYAKLLKEKDFAARLETSATEQLTMRLLIAGRVDGALFSEFTGLSAAKLEKAGDKVEIHPIAVDEEDALHFIASKKNFDEKFIKEFDATLKAMRADGSYDKIVNKYK